MASRLEAALESTGASGIDRNGTREEEIMTKTRRNPLMIVAIPLISSALSFFPQPSAAAESPMASPWPPTTRANAYWSPDGTGLGSGAPIYGGCSPLTVLAPYDGGVLAGFTNVGCRPGVNAILWTPDLSHLGGGDLRYRGCSRVTAMLPYRGGVVTAFADVGCEPGKYSARWSANGKNLGSGEVVYTGCSPITAMTEFRGGIITAFGNVGCVPTDNAAFWSPDGKSLDSGETVYRDCSPITALATTSAGVLAAFSKFGCVEGQYSVLLSSDGKNLGSGKPSYRGISPVISLAPYSSGVLAVFSNVDGSANVFRLERAEETRIGAGAQLYRGLSAVTVVLPFGQGVIAGVVQLEPVVQRSWQEHLIWCIGNTDAGGSVDCVSQYLATYPGCWMSGGRSCLMGKARQSAVANDCANAFALAIQCQCHNPGAASQIRGAGQAAVCQYLGPPATPPRQAPSSDGRGNTTADRPPAPLPDYYVAWRYDCRYENDSDAGDCLIVQHSPISCQEAMSLLQQSVQANGDVCKHCPGPGSNITDSSKHVVGAPHRITGAGPCFGL